MKHVNLDKGKTNNFEEPIPESVFYKVRKRQQ